MKKLSILIILSILCFCCVENIAAQKILSVAELKEDASVLRKTLKKLHPGIYRYQTTESLEKVFDDFESKLENPLPEGEFFKLISQLTNQLFCGHTFPNPYNQNTDLRERLFGGKTHLPFYFQIVEGKIIATENASSQNLARGSEIRKINGVSAKEIIEKLLTATRGDGRNTLAHRVSLVELTRFEAERYALFDWYFPLFFPFDNQTFTIEALDFASKKRVNFKVPAMTRKERTIEMEKRYGKTPDYDDGWKFEIWAADSTAYLKIDNSITWRLKRIKFKEFIANSFAEMRSKEVKNLIVDLRGNDGGDTGVGFELARHLATKENLPAYITSRRFVRNVGAVEPDLLKYLDTYSKELKAILQDDLPANVYQASAENGLFEILPSENTTSYPKISPAENSFTGKSFVISDAENASAAFQFMNYVKENKLATIVGQPTGGNRQGINGGNYIFLYLPNSKIEVDIPVYYIAPFTPQKDESVVPDVSVKRKAEDVGKNFDREVLMIKELIRQNRAL